MSAAFVDTSAWFDFFIAGQTRTNAVRKAITEFDGRLVTSDFVIDELMTLLRVRKQNARHVDVWKTVTNADWVEVLSTTEADMKSAYAVFSKYKDKQWSFTDCLSYHYIRAGKLTHAIATDEHFREFGTVVVLPEAE